MYQSVIARISQLYTTDASEGAAESLSTQGEGSLLQLLGMCSWFRITAEGCGF